MMILICVNKGDWSLKLPNGYELRGREATAGEALCKATALAARLEALLRRKAA
jgi:hypothetical protein